MVKDTSRPATTHGKDQTRLHHLPIYTHANYFLQSRSVTHTIGLMRIVPRFHEECPAAGGRSAVFEEHSATIQDEMLTHVETSTPSCNPAIQLTFSENRRGQKTLAVSSPFLVKQMDHPTLDYHRATARNPI